MGKLNQEVLSRNEYTKLENILGQTFQFDLSCPPNEVPAPLIKVVSVFLKQINKTFAFWLRKPLNVISS